MNKDERCFLFDIDGTLVNLRAIWEQTYTDLYQKVYGFRLTESELKSMFGPPELEGHAQILQGRGMHTSQRAEELVHLTEQAMVSLLSKKNISDILTTQYDVVLNGWEIGGGSIRNHKPDALEAVFEIMGFKKERIKENFGHMLEALGYGAPPHGGIAWGLDRLISLLNNEPNIREVISFPKTGDARDLMMNSPSELEGKQLKELHIKTEK